MLPSATKPAPLPRFDRQPRKSRPPVRHAPRFPHETVPFAESRSRLPTRRPAFTRLRPHRQTHPAGGRRFHGARFPERRARVRRLRGPPAANGQQALDLAAGLSIDLVLLDLNMPVKNGWDTFEQLTREHPLVPIIIVTARPNQIFTVLNAGAGALLEKPMDIPTLLRTMEKLLAEPAGQRLARLAGRESDFHYKSATMSRERSLRAKHH